MIKITTTIKDPELVAIYESLSDDEKEAVNYELTQELKITLEDVQICLFLNGKTGLVY